MTEKYLMLKSAIAALNLVKNSKEEDNDICSFIYDVKEVDDTVYVTLTASFKTKPVKPQQLTIYDFIGDEDVL